MIRLIRLDYRLLHGQVIVSWVKAMDAQRVIIVDDDTVKDDLKKSVLKLAKPSGISLNIFSVERVVEKMPKIERLAENIIMIFGKTSCLLRFMQHFPKYSEVNYGATANADGALQVGQSVFLNEEQIADTKELLQMGVEIVVQQTAGSTATKLSSL